MGGKLNPTSILPLIDCDWTVVWRWEMTFNVVYCWSSIVITGWWQRFSVNAFPGATVCAVVSHSHVWSVLILCNLMTAVLESWKKKKSGPSSPTYWMSQYKSAIYQRAELPFPSLVTLYCGMCLNNIVSLSKPSQFTCAWSAFLLLPYLLKCAHLLQQVL